MNRRPFRHVTALAAAALLVVTAGCADDSSPGDTVTLRLVAYDSFPSEDSGVNTALAAFTERTGIGVQIVNAGDTGTMLTKAELTAGRPEGDVMWGIDSTLLSRALERDVFTPYASSGLDGIPAELTALVPGGELTPVDFGDVCLNYDIAWFADRDLAPPATLDDLTDPRYKGLLVVENPVSSSPGLAFLLATIAHFGENGWQQYWRDLRANDVAVVDSWDVAYYESFSGSSGKGPDPLVVSYASSPPAEVLFADPPRTDAPTAMLPATCYRQVEFAGILRGTRHADEARALIDFLVGDEFQREIPLSLFVHPARSATALPKEFTDHAVVPADPFTLPPADIAAGRERWIDTWTQIVLR